MTDKELNMAILDQLYKIADSVWSLMDKDSIVGSFTAHEVVKHIGADIFWGANDAKKLHKIEVENFRCEFQTNQIFDLAVKFELLTSVGNKRHLFVAESKGEVEGSVTFAVTKELEDLCNFADPHQFIYPNIIIDAERKCLIATNGHIMKVCPVTLYKKWGDTSAMRILAADFKKMCARMKRKNVYRLTAKKERSGYDIFTNIAFEGIVARSEHAFALPKCLSVFSARSSELCFDVQDWKAVNKLSKMRNGEDKLAIRGNRGEKYVMFEIGNCKLQVFIGKALKHSFCLLLAKEQLAKIKKAESMRLYLGAKDSDFIEAVDNNGHAYILCPETEEKITFVGEHVDDILIAPEVVCDIDVLERYVLKKRRAIKSASSKASATEKAVAKKEDKPAKQKDVDNTRKFTFSAIGVKSGDKLTFVDGKEVVAVDDNKVSFEGNTYTLSGFCKVFMPAEKRNKSNSYRGCAFFYRNGVKLEKLFNNALQGKEQPVDGVAVTATPQVEAHAEKVEPNVTEPIVTECEESSHVEKPRYVFAASLRMLRQLNYTLRHSPRHGTHGRNGVRQIPPAMCSWLKGKNVHTYSLPPPPSPLPIRS